jgi:hypothetical protein
MPKGSARARRVRRGRARAQGAGPVDIARDAGTEHAAPRASAAEAGGSKSPNLPDWRWRSFPVFAAFVAGVLLDSLINPASSTPAVALRLLALLAVGYAVAHIVVTNVIVARRIRAHEREEAGGPAASAEHDEEEEWEDEVVYPGES